MAFWTKNITAKPGNEGSSLRISRPGDLQRITQRNAKACASRSVLDLEIIAGVPRTTAEAISVNSGTSVDIPVISGTKLRETMISPVHIFLGGFKAKINITSLLDSINFQASGANANDDPAFLGARTATRNNSLIAGLAAIPAGSLDR